jgi:hypothetical protein
MDGALRSGDAAQRRFLYYSNDSRAEMNAQLAATTAWIWLHVRRGLFLYPMAITGGILPGALAGTASTPAGLMATPRSAGYWAVRPWY